MMVNISEEAGINGAMQLCTEATHSVGRFTGWLTRTTGTVARTTVSIVKGVNAKKDKSVSDLVSDACSAYRGGFIKSKDSEPLKELINDLRGTEKARADGNFFFLGNKSDLSYFWKKTDSKNNVILLREHIDSISDSYVRKGTLSAMTQAQVDGILTYDGKAYALTEKGKSYIYDPAFIANRLDGEEKFLKKAQEALGGELESIHKGETMFIFDNGTAGHEYTVTRGEIVEGKTHVGFYSETEGELWLPKDALGEVAFADETTAQEYLKANPENVADWQRVINAQKDAITEHFSKNVAENENSYFVKVGDTNKYEFLEIPKGDTEILKDGSLKAKIYGEKKYTVHTGNNTYTVNGEGAKNLLGEGAKNIVDATAKAAEKAAEGIQKGVEKVGEAVRNAAEKTAEAVGKTVEAAAETAETAAPPVKAVSMAVNVVYESVKETAKTTIDISKKVVAVSQKL